MPADGSQQLMGPLAYTSWNFSPKYTVYSFHMNLKLLPGKIKESLRPQGLLKGSVAKEKWQTLQCLAEGDETNASS